MEIDYDTYFNEAMHEVERENVEAENLREELENNGN